MLYRWRADLVKLITDGASLAQVTRHFAVTYHFGPGQVREILKTGRVEFVIPPPSLDGISAKRRWELQELSIRE